MSVIYGDLLAQQIYDDLRQKIIANSKKPSLAVILIGDNPASKVYVAAKEKACKRCGISAKTYTLNNEVKEEEEVIALIKDLNLDKNIDGILLQLPLPPHLKADKIINYISPFKDVDGLTQANVFKLYNGEDDGFVPCTPLGVLTILKTCNIDLKGQNVLVVGRSKLVGLPLFHLLNKNNATVTLAHSYTRNLKEISLHSDIVISAIGKAHYFNETFFKEDACVIDVGISKIDGKIKGDVDWQAIKDKVRFVTPTPCGTGPLTVAMLMANTYKAFKEHKL